MKSESFAPFDGKSVMLKGTLIYRGNQTMIEVQPDSIQVMRRAFVSILLVALAWPAFAQTKTLLNLDKTGVAIQGHDPVAFFTDNKPVKGKPEFPARHNGALYFFASKEHRGLFKSDPAKYEPMFGGYCAYGV